MARERNRTARIEARIAPEVLATVRRAAEMQGRSVSTFVVAAAQEAARKMLEEAHLIHLSMEDQLRFAETLLDPPALAEPLERARESHARLFDSSSE